MSRPVRYARVCGLEGGTLNVKLEALCAALSVRGIEQIGVETSSRLREELRGLPTFEGLIGPMWDGGAVRYETPARYTELSS